MKEQKIKDLTARSTIGSLYKTPVGHDILEKLLLQTGISRSAVTNPVVANLPLSIIPKLMGGKLSKDFLRTFLHLVNSEKEVPGKGSGTYQPAWWKEAVFYQIYPRSFCDGNGDGIGDLQGIISKLDYLKDLGVDALWLSPIYDSPMDDNGYDIRDYRAINPDFGTMEEFDELLAGVHARGMRLIMDLVVNHTSDEHEWFRKALADPGSKYRDYYFFRPGNGGKTPPNNWNSFFAGSAWNYYPEQDVYALHLFSKKQMDLNWDNPDVRADVAEMVNWWFEKGVDGFRMDVINYISKEEGLPDGDPAIGALMNFNGVEHYFYGPHLNEYLHELHERSFAKHGAFSVGETPGVGMELAKLLTGEERGELDMIFSFDQLETPGHVRYDDYRYDLNYYREYITDWMENYGSNCWMSLFYNNHDNPRMVSKVDRDPAYRPAVESLLAVMQMTLRGTPFVFQGDEMGLVNYDFRSMDEITDVEAKGFYRELTEERGKTPEEAMAMIRTGTREHARILLPWHDFPEETPPHLVQSADGRITEMYRQLIALRRAHKALIYGDFRIMDRRKGRFVYCRKNAAEEFVIECSLDRKPKRAAFAGKGYELVFANGRRIAEEEAGKLDLAALCPYEARIWKKL